LVFIRFTKFPRTLGKSLVILEREDRITEFVKEPKKLNEQSRYFFVFMPQQNKSNKLLTTKILRYLFPLLFLFVFEYIVFQGLVLVIATCPDWLQLLIRSLYWLMPLAFWFVMSRRMARRETPLEINKGAFLFSNCLLGLYFGKMITFAVLGADMVRRIFMLIFGKITGAAALSYPLSTTVATLALVLGLALAAVLIYGMLRNRYRYKIHRKTVKISNLPAALKGLKIIQLSDIHSGSFTEINPLNKAITLINKEEADLVFFTGDLVNNVASEMQPFIPIFKKIKSKFGVFSILGNHDYGDYVLWKSTEAKLQNFNELIQTHRELGWDLLLNENRLLNIKDSSLAIIGVENYSAKGRFSKYGDLSRAVVGTESADVKLLLSHDPSHWSDQVLTKHKDIAITFSGHTHGMQFGIDIPGWFQWSPVQYFYKQWAGLYQEGKQYLYVNRGFGFLGYPGRVGVLAEITVITLDNKE
jgi:predicted MPP superfamily phosphohydrolase